MNFDYCEGRIHVVEEGDSLYTLSKKYRVPLARIMRANPYVDVYNLTIGSEICIPLPMNYRPRPERPIRPISMPERNVNRRRVEFQPEEMSPFNNGRNNYDNNNNENSYANERNMMEDDTDEIIQYVIKEGDSVSSILEQYALTLEDLLKFNTLDTMLLKPGTTLYFPEKKDENGMV